MLESEWNKKQKNRRSRREGLLYGVIKNRLLWCVYMHYLVIQES